MIIFDATTSSLEFKLLGAVSANELPFVAAWADHTAALFTPGHTDGISNGTTAVTAVAAPGASTQRQLKTLAIFNDDTVAAVVIVQYNNNGTIRQLTEISVPANGTLIYTDGEGFRVIDSSGQILTTTPDVTRSNVAETITAGWAFASEIDAQAGIDISGGAVKIGGSTVIDASENADFGGTLDVGGDVAIIGDQTWDGDTTVNAIAGDLTIGADPGSVDAGSFVALAVDGEVRLRCDPGGNTIVAALVASQNVVVADTKRVFLDGVGISGGDTYIEQNSANVLRCVAGGSGGVDLTSGATAWAAVSDERLKTIIEPIIDAVDKVSQLRAVIGRFKTDRDYKRRAFLIAQDVEKVLPEAVTRQSPLPDALLGIKYEKVIPLLVAAINELATDVAELKGMN